ncbi:MAG: MFS transporter [Micropruina sp.]|nr:MFS transporter [Micropruina sp.]
MALYLLGIFMGAIDTGIVTPARTIIQNDFGVDDKLGIWMITIYTLAYAASIPVMGKLADRLGRKQVYLLAIALFGVGSLACGLSESFGGFWMLIGARAVQAIGGGGIIPIATAEIGTEVPPEKRGLALGLVGGVYGIANIFGASAGSLILDIVGAHNWQWIFYVNVPIAIVIVIVGIIVLPNHKASEVKPLDIGGTVLLVAMILSLLYGLRNIDFFAFGSSLTATTVWPYLLGFVLALPVFILVERRASDPVLNLRFFTSRTVGTVLVLALLSGFILMAVIFVPQFAENALHVPTGSGGYFVIILGLTSGIGAPMSGRLTDQLGPKLVLTVGGLASLAAAATVLFWTIPHPSYPSVITALALFGLGLGFVIGSPLNYMMLERTEPEESNSALATLALMRSLGTTIAPAIMVGFLAQAGTLLQDRLTTQLPTEVAAPALPYQAELQAKFAAMKDDAIYADQLKDVTLPDLTARQTIKINTSGSGTLDPDLVELLKTADVTTIVARTKTVATRMFDKETPKTVADIEAGVQTGIDGLNTGLAKLVQAQADMTASITTMDSNLATMDETLSTMTAKIASMDSTIAEMTKGIGGMDSGLAGLTKAAAGIQSGITGMDSGLAQQKAALAALEAAPPSPATTGQITGLKAAIAQLQSQRDAAAAQLASVKAQQATLQAQRAKLASGLAGVKQGRAALTKAKAELTDGRAQLADARTQLDTARADVMAAQVDLQDTLAKMAALKAGVQPAFAAALTTYLGEIDARGPTLEATYQSTLNEGFAGVFEVYAAAVMLMLLVLLMTPNVRRKPSEVSQEVAEEVAERIVVPAAH